MEALFYSSLNLLFLIYTSFYCVKRRVDSAVFFYCLITLYFINIPLFYDSFMVLSHGMSYWERYLQDVNIQWSSNTLTNINIIARDSLVFNCCFIFSYYYIKKKRLLSQNLNFRPYGSNTITDLSWRRCFFLSYFGLAIFMVYNQISSFSMMDVGEWYENRLNNRVIALLSTIFVPLMSVGVIRAFYAKNIIGGLLVIAPVLIIGIFTGARSQIIPVVFYVIYFFIWSNAKLKLKNILLFGGIAFALVLLLTISRETVTAIYPVYKDWAYIDLFYSYDVASSISTHGLNSLVMIARDILPVQVQDITTLVADTKYGVGWGSLHPSLLGWAYIDLLNLNWLLAIFFGVLMAIYDRLRHNMPNAIYFMFLSYEFAFLAIAIRGSVQFAYSQLFYPIVILILLFIFDKSKVIKCHYDRSNNGVSIAK